MWSMFADKGTLTELEVDVSLVIQEPDLWKRFTKYLRREYRKVAFPRQGIVCIRYDENNMTSFAARALVTSVLSEFMDRYRPLELQEERQKTEKKLPLDLHPEAVTYLLYGTRLAILQTDPVICQWLLSYFMDVRLFYNENYFNYYFLEEAMEQVLGLEEISYFQVARQGDILSYIKIQLNQGIYVNVHLDEFYVSSKDHFERKHFVHENLIYGYDDTEKKIYAFGFTKNQKMKDFSMSYEEFLTAYEKGKLFYFCGAEYLEREYPWPVMRYWIKRRPEVEFTFEILKEKLSAYMNPPADEMVQGDIHIYGMNVYYMVIKCLKGESDMPVDFRTFQLFYEQKKCILRRLRYISEKNKLQEKWKTIIRDYQEITDKFQQIRLVYLKQLWSEGKKGLENQTIENAELCYSIAEKLERVLEAEKFVLREVCKEEPNDN